MKKEMYDELYRTEQVHFFSCAKREITEALLGSVHISGIVI